MDLIHDWKFWAFIVTITGIVINYLASQKIATNHLAHVAQDLEEIKNEQKVQGLVQNGMQLDIAYIKGKQDNNERIVEILNKRLSE